MIVNIIEFLNALSMVPLLLISLNNTEVCIAPLATKYAFTIFSVCSINYHLYRTFNRHNIEGSTQSFKLDATSQNISILLTSYFSNNPYANMLLMSFIIIFIELVLDLGKPLHKAFRYMLLSCGIVYMFHYNLFIIGNLFLATLSYILAKVSSLTFGHVFFHIFSSIAINHCFQDMTACPLNIYNQYIPIVHIVFMCSIIYLEYKIPTIYTSCPHTLKTIKGITSVLMSSMFLILYSTHVYENIGMYTEDNLIKLSYDPMLDIYFCYQIGYYLAYTFVEVMEKNKEMFLHHVISMLVISLTKFSKMHYLASLALLLFSASTPFLAMSKLLRHTKKENASKICFVLFGIVFFFCRVVGSLYILKISIVNLYNILTSYSYIVINASMLSLYVMQLLWMQKILKLIFNTSSV